MPFLQRTSSPLNYLRHRVFAEVAKALAETPSLKERGLDDAHLPLTRPRITYRRNTSNSSPTKRKSCPCFLGGLDANWASGRSEVEKKLQLVDK